MRAAVATCLVGCTSLGPMPATTGVSAVAGGRPGGELQAAVMPAYRLSAAARGDDRHGEAIAQILALFEPDRLLGAPGLFAAGRVFGEDGETAIEPLIGYRRTRGTTSLGVIGYGTKMRGEENGASYEALRLGGELVAAAELASFGTWGSVDAQAAASATYLSASGRYCVQSDGNATDCAEDGSIPRIAGELEGVYSSAALTLAFDVGRRWSSSFHGARLAAMVAMGHMPRLIAGRQQWGDLYVSGGLSLTLGFGSATASP